MGVFVPNNFKRRSLIRTMTATAAGRAGTGASKRRSPEHYKRMSTLWRSKNLDEGKIREIRLSKLTCRQLAMKFKVHPSTISLIKNRKRWASVA